MNIFLTGEKQAGKSTVIKKALRGINCRLSGFYTVREKELMGDWSVHVLKAGSDETPSKENLLFYPTRDNKKVYRFDTLAVDTMADAGNANLVIMDEIGFGEDSAEAFQKRVREILDSEIPVLGVLQKNNGRHPYRFAGEIASRPDVKVIEVNVSSRDSLVGYIKKVLLL